MKKILAIIPFIFVGFLGFSQVDNIDFHVQMDTLEVFTHDSVLADLTIYDQNEISSMRTAILTWYKVKVPRFDLLPWLLPRTGINLEVVYHGEKVTYLEDGKIRVEQYNSGKLIESILYDKQNQKLNEVSEKFDLTENQKFTCTLDILNIMIISEYGFPKKIKNYRQQ